VIPGSLSARVKWPGLEADHSPPSSAEVKTLGAVPPFSQYAFMAWCLIRAMDTTLWLFNYSDYAPANGRMTANETF
jgi:hypothetical protein